MFIWAFIYFITAQASVYEMFAPSASTMSVGNQATTNLNDSSNLYHAPSLLAFADKSTLSLNFIHIEHNFRPIEDIVLSNELNSDSSAPLYGEAEINYDDLNFLSFHSALKLFRNSHMKLGISILLPMNSLLNVNTSDPYRPEYIMYQSRNSRPIIHLNLAQQYNENWSYSVGVNTSVSSDGQTKIVATENGSDDNPTSGQLNFKVSPQTGLIFCVSYKDLQQVTYLSYSQQLSSKITNDASGITPLSSSSIKYSWDMSSMLYYDPEIIKLGHIHHFKEISLLGQLEHQNWSNYQSPILRFENSGGALSSSRQFGTVSATSITIAKVAVEYDMFSLGYFYRPSPIETNLNAASNSIDTDKQVYSMGYKFHYKLLGSSFDIHFAIQYHDLVSRKVTKSAGVENGSTGAKIGSPGYTTGGNIWASAVGLNWSL